MINMYGLCFSNSSAISMDLSHCITLWLPLNNGSTHLMTGPNIFRQIHNTHAQLNEKCRRKVTTTTATTTTTKSVIRLWKTTFCGNFVKVERFIRNDVANENIHTQWMRKRHGIVSTAFAASAQCLSHLFVLVFSWTSSSYIAVYFFFCRQNSFWLQILIRFSWHRFTWRYMIQKKNTFTDKTHQIIAVKKLKENITLWEKKWWEI